MPFIQASFIWPMILLFTLSFDVYAQDKAEGMAVMKPTDRDWEYFKTIPCSELNKIIVHSETEKNLLDKRTQECTNQYKAFFPAAGPTQ